MLVESRDAVRIARHAERHGYPRFSDDPVVQFAVEEALDLRMALDTPSVDAAAFDASAAATEASLARAQRIFGG